jgi:hypothetical protein
MPVTERTAAGRGKGPAQAEAVGLTRHSSRMSLKRSAARRGVLIGLSVGQPVQAVPGVGTNLLPLHPTSIRQRSDLLDEGVVLYRLPPGRPHAPRTHRGSHTVKTFMTYELSVCT